MLQLTDLGPRLAAGGTAELYAWQDDRILKLYWRGAALDAAEREAERARAAHAAGAASPAVYDVVTIEQRAGVVFERVHGPSMLEVLGDEPERAESLAQQLAQLQADFHGRRPLSLPPLREHLIRRVNLGPLPARHKPPVLTMLREFPDGEALCHGDLHPGNVLMTGGGARAIDWFDATAGNPAADFARTALLLQYGRLGGAGERQRTLEALRARFLAAYLECYEQLRPRTAQDLQQWFLPVAAARIAEPISGQERVTLLRVIDTLLAEA
jgi:aminoglycoside phosphotransferase (APT) family kinase protein